MPGSLPALSTAAMAQYPFERAPAFAVEAVEFLDTSRQVYRDTVSAKRTWMVALEKLDEQEIARLKEFFIEQRGSWGTFSFTDPHNGSVHPNCSFAEDSFPHQQSEEGRHQTRLTIYEHV